MDVDIAAEILAGSILTVLAFVVFVVGIVIINNLLHKYWKPVNFGYFVPKVLTEDPKRFATEDEMAQINVNSVSTSTEVKAL